MKSGKITKEQIANIMSATDSLYDELMSICFMFLVNDAIFVDDEKVTGFEIDKWLHALDEIKQKFTF